MTLLSALVAVALLAAATTAAPGDPCSFTPSPAGATLRQDSACDVTAPYCTWTLVGGTPVGRCTVCRIGQANDPCLCDRATSYCEQGTSAPGTCQPYTLLGAGCTTDNDCRTTTNAIVAGGLPLQTQSVVNEALSCVLGTCQPCNPTTWADGYGPLNTPYTCPGYFASASNLLGRYAAVNSRPGTQISCNVAGQVTVNSTIDYSYGYGADWTTWTPASASSSRPPSPSRGASGVSPSSVPSVDSDAARLGMCGMAVLTLIALLCV
jgi:hypothetical protein